MRFKALLEAKKFPKLDPWEGQDLLLAARHDDLSELKDELQNDYPTASYIWASPDDLRRIRKYLRSGKKLYSVIFVDDEHPNLSIQQVENHYVQQGYTYITSEDNMGNIEIIFCK